MMKRTIHFALAAALVAVTAFVRADSNHSMEPYTGSKAFESIKKLDGHWEGTSKEKDKTEKVAVDYHVTSGGSAVIETLFPGTPHEMTSIYAEDNGRLTMTHYCMLHNHPRMEFKGASGSDLSFSLASDGNVDPASMHMHALILTIPGDNQLAHKWTLYEGGKEKGVTLLSFTRKG